MSSNQDQVVVVFVRQTKKPPSSICEEAFEALKDVGGEMVWKSEEECMEVKDKDRRHLYVFEHFEGTAFEHIASVGNRIYGPVCILTCLKHSETLPKLPHPLYSLAMKGMVISCTSLVKEMREEVHRKTQWMMGEVSKDFHERVTHLVAGEVGSKKYLVAANIGKKIMSPEWISATFEASGSSFVHAAEARFDQYKCPLFKGLVVTVSGLDSDERSEIKEVVSREGGSYSGEMKINECTHLIINIPRGQKYEFAKKWKINIVTPKWMFDSLEAGYCLEEHRYKAADLDMPPPPEEDKQTTSTPTTKSRTTRLSCLNDVSAISVTHINDTALHNQTANNTLLPVRGHLQAVEEDPLAVLDVTAVKGAMFLDGCRIFLSGFKGARLEKLKKIINLGGGTRFNQINESVSHVVLGDKIVKDHKTLEQASFRPHIVTAEWLVESFKQCECAPEAEYYCMDLPQLDPTSPPPKSSLIKRVGSDRTLTETPQPQPQTNAEEDMHELMSQYLPQNVPDMTDESCLVRAAAALELEAQEPSSRQPEDDDDATQDTGQETMVEEEKQDDGTLFKGRQFVLVGFDPGDEEELALYVQENGGKVLSLSTRKVPDYAVVPLFGYPVNITVEEVVTNAWLQMCLEAEELLPVDSNELFTPFIVHEDATPLNGCVLSISGYGGTERDVLMHVAELLGGRCQEYFVKKASKNLERSTHLIVSAAEGSKYTAAKKWKLPAVTKQWLFQCAKTGRRAKEADFLVDKPQLESMETTTTSAEDTANVSKGKGNTSKSLKDSTTTSNASTSNSKASTSTSMPSTSHADAPEPMEVADEVNDLNPSNKENESEMDTREAPSMKANVEVSKETNTSTSSVVTPKVVNQRVKKLIAENKAETPKQSPSQLELDTPSKFLDPKKIYNPTFNLTEVLAALESPEDCRSKKGKHQRKSSLPLEELYAYHIGLAVKNSSMPKAKKAAAAAAAKDEDEEDEVVFKKVAPGPLHGVVIAVSKKLSSQQGQFNNLAASLGADYRWTYDNSCTHFIFQGREKDTNREFRVARDNGKIIVCPHWLYICEEQMARVDESLFPHTYNPNMSLSVSKSQTPARFTRRSSRLTRSKKKQDDYVPQPSPPEPRPDQPFSDLDTTQSDEEIAMACAGVEDMEKQNTQESLVRNIKDLMAATKSTKTYSKNRRKSKRSSTSFDKILQDELGTSSKMNNSGKNEDEPVVAKKGRPTRAGSKSKAGGTTQTLPEQSQVCGEVAWDDPDARAQQLIMAADLAKNSESFSPPHHGVPFSDEESRGRATTSTSEEGLGYHLDLAVKKSKKTTPRQSLEDERVPTPEAPSLAFPVPRSVRPVSPPKPIQDDLVDGEETMDIEPQPKPTFLLSGMAQQERTDYGALVEELGGEMSDAPHYDSRCTHLVVGNPTRNEKYLACVASGRWVLHKSYFEECRQHGRFVEEEQHEWGGEGTASILGSLPANVSKLAQAAHRWRLRMRNIRETKPDSRGAFEGWTVMLLTDKKREDGFRRLLEAGGAQVMPAKPPFANLEEVTHAFMDLNKISIEVDLDVFVHAGVHCVKPEYIASFLMEHPQPSPEDYYISEVKKLVSSTGSRKRRISQPSTPNSKRCRK